MVQCQIEKTIVPWNPHQHKTYTYYKIMFWRRAKWRSWWMDGWSPMGPVEANGKHLQQKSKIVVCRTISCFFIKIKKFLNIKWNIFDLSDISYFPFCGVCRIHKKFRFFFIELFMNTSFNNNITFKVWTDKIRIIARKKWSYLPKFRRNPGGRVLQFWHRLQF